VDFGTLWRCGDGLFFEVPPSARDALLTTLHPLLENVLAASFRKIEEQEVLTTRFTFRIRFSVFKALPPLENISSSQCIVSINLMDEL
jgi:hypothetical protein